jgi:serine protease Do
MAAPLASQESNSAWMGLYIRDVDADDVEALGLERRVRGVVVSGIDDEGPAARAGVVPGDVITKFDGRAVGDRGEFMRQLGHRQPGENVRITVVRDSGPETYEFELEPRPRELQRFAPYDMRFDTRRGIAPVFRPGGAQLGVYIHDLEDADLAAYFGVDPGKGVLVTGVVDDSRNPEGGVQGGDIILAIDEEPVESTVSLRAVLAAYDVGDEVSVRVRRKNRERTVKVALTESSLSMSTLRVPGVMMRDDVGDLRRELRDIRREIRRLEREINQQRGR